MGKGKHKQHQQAPKKAPQLAHDEAQHEKITTVPALAQVIKNPFLTLDVQEGVDSPAAILPATPPSKSQMKKAAAQKQIEDATDATVYIPKAAADLNLSATENTHAMSILLDPTIDQTPDPLGNTLYTLDCLASMHITY